MIGEIISIGDELLIGQVVNTNSTFIAKALNKIGISVHQITTVEDERSHILSSLKEASQRADLVIITGGLGPTRDDVTKACLCDYFQDELVENSEVLAHIENLFKTYIEAPISDLNRKQALLPSKAKVIPNKYGTAAGMWFEQEDVVYISLPGVPFEMKALMEEEVLPRLQKNFKRPFILHKTVITYGVAESALAEKMKDWEDQLPEYIKLAYLPNLGKVYLRLTAKGDNEEHLKNSVESLITDLYPLIGDHILGFEDEDPVEIQIGRFLSRKKQTIATAESCTGGRIANLFASPPGASLYYKGSLVTYATEIKEGVLQIPASLIREHSVVSAPVAEAMAAKVKELFKADYSIATTGNAGPSKGDSSAEVGTVFIGIATPHRLFSRKFVFGNHREKVIGKAVAKSMELFLQEIFKETGERV